MLLSKASFDFFLTSASRAFAKNDDNMSVVMSSRRGTIRVKTAMADSLCSDAGKDALNRLPSRLDFGLVASGNRQQIPLIIQIINCKALVDIHPMEACMEEGTHGHILSIRFLS